MKTRINNIFIICLFGLLINFTYNIIQYLSHNNNITGIELAAEQNDEESRDSEENKENEENKEKTETQIDNFFGDNLDFMIELYSTNSNFSGYFDNYTFNEVHDLNTPPPEFIS